MDDEAKRKIAQWSASGDGESRDNAGHHKRKSTRLAADGGAFSTVENKTSYIAP